MAGIIGHIWNGSCTFTKRARMKLKRTNKHKQRCTSSQHRHARDRLSRWLRHFLPLMDMLEMSCMAFELTLFLAECLTGVMRFEAGAWIGLVTWFFGCFRMSSATRFRWMSGSNWISGLYIIKKIPIKSIDGDNVIKDANMQPKHSNNIVLQINMPSM
jgi:hypothetical protein